MDRKQIIFLAVLFVLLCAVVVSLPSSAEITAPTGLCISEVCAKNEKVLAAIRIILSFIIQAPL